MKQFVKKIIFLLLAVCLCLGPVQSGMNTVKVSAASSKAKTGWVKEAGGYCYYYKAGKKYVNCMKTIKGKKYYFGADGVRKTGWYSVKNKSYYFDSQGVLQSKKTKSINANLLKKMDSAIKKAGVKTGTSKKNALKLLFNYVSNKSKFGYLRAERGFDCPKGWEYTYAKQMLTNKKGSCYHYAATFAFLAKRATGYPVRICWGQSNAFNKNTWQNHAWVEVKISGKWYTFDTNAACYSTRKVNGKKINWYMQKSGTAKKYFKLEGELKGTADVEL